MEKAVELLFLQDKIRDMTKEYFLFVGETKSRKVPLTAYPRLQKAIFRARSALNKNLKTENLKSEATAFFSARITTSERNAELICIINSSAFLLPR